MKKRIVILGAGESGVGAAILAKAKEFDVFVSDFGVIKPEYVKQLNKYNIHWEERKHSEELILNANEIIISPGIPFTVEIVQKAISKSIPIISEIEFAGRYTDAVKICITGSNGKTTTTMLIYHILKSAGLNVGMAGNVGNSFAKQVAEENFDYYVIELSSFQLDSMFDFRAEIAILMNITPDHLDRYEYDFNKYIDSKFRIARNQRNTEHFIYCSDDETTIGELEKRDINATQLPFSLEKKVENGAYTDNNKLMINYNKTQFTMTLQDLALQGKHNTYNSMAAGVACNVLKIRKDNIRECLSDFQGVEHRLENYLKIHGVQFINDSKATNINSTWYALETMHAKTIWIVGGIDKGNDYSILEELVKKKVKAIICLGTDNSKIHKAFDGVIETIVDTSTMADAVKASYLLSNKGDNVLLSPACASFDLFQNYEDRGRQFKHFVREL